MIYRTLNDRKYTDPSLRTLRFNRTLRDAGWQWSPDPRSRITPAGYFWIGYLAVIGALVLLVML